MRWSSFFERYRTVTNYAGTVILAWWLSLIAVQAIRVFFQDSPSAEAAISLSDERPLASTPRTLSHIRGIEDYMRICTRNIFDSDKRSPCTADIVEEEDTEPEYDTSAAPVRSDLAVTLLGTTVSSIPHLSFATVAKRGSAEAETYRIDDLILGEAKIYSIVRNRVYFTRNGRREYIEAENLPSVFAAPAHGAASPDGGDIKIVGDRVTVSRAKVDSTLSDLNQVIQDARMVPHFKDGSVSGFKVFAIRPNSIFQQLGLRNGDVIERINGTEINSVERAIPMLQLAKESDSITIDLQRRNRKQTLSIDIQ